MTRAEKEEMMKKFQESRDAQKAAEPVIVAAPAIPAVKTFEVDGEQVAYEAPKPPAKAVREISSAWKEISKNRA